MPNQQFDNTDRFVLFGNDKKVEGSKQPDYRGEITLSADVIREAARNGGDFTLRLSGWRHQAKNDGRYYLSGRVSLPETAPAASPNAGYGTPPTAPQNDSNVGFGPGQTNPF